MTIKSRPVADSGLRGAAQTFRADFPACAVPRHKSDRLQQGVPSPQLLSLLGVLRRPATPADRLASLYLTGPSRTPGAYVHYIRRARVAFGARYFVIPALSSGVTPACTAAERIRVRREAIRVPKPLRPTVLESALSVGFQSQYEGVALIALGPNRSGWGFGPITARQLATDPPVQPNPVIFGLVPDGVASVQLSLKVQESHRQRMLLVSTRPVANVFVIRHPRGFNGNRLSKIVWRAANGSILRTITDPPV